MLIAQSYINHILSQCDAFSLRQEREAKEAVNKRLDEVYKIYTSNIKQTFVSYSMDVIVRFAEIAVEIHDKFAYAQNMIQYFLQRIQATSQFYIRALLVKAKVISYNGHRNNQKGQAIITVLKQALTYITKALDLITGPQEAPQKGKDPKAGGENSNKAKYAFLIYNASTSLYKITRFMLRQSWIKNFTEIYQRIYKLFDQLDQPDHNWKCRFYLILFQCLYDSQKKPDAFKILDLLWEKTKNKPCDFQDSLFRLRVHFSKENNALVALIKKDTEGQDPNGWKILQILQRMKSGGIPQAQVQKQLMTVVNQISVNVLSNNQQASNSSNLSPILQERLAEAGRIALKFNLISIASSITNFLTKAKQPNQKAIILNQYNKAELLIKKKGDLLDKKTGMMMNLTQIKQLEIENRKEALKIMEKVMIINKKLDNSDLIYQGSVLIWNLSLPFMCKEYQNNMAKAFDISVNLLQQIESTDQDLRTKMHLQLANIYFGNEVMFVQVESNIMKALKLDHSIPINKLQYKFEPEEDSSLYYRPYQRYLQDFQEKIQLKTMQTLNPTDLDTVTQDLWNVELQKSETTKIDILQKCLRTLINFQQPPFTVSEEQMLVEEEIKLKKIQYEKNKLKRYKKKKFLASEVAHFSFEWQLNDFAKKACDFVLADTWESKNALELIIVQSKCCYFMAQIKIDELNQENYEVPFEAPVKINEEEETKENQQKLKSVSAKKNEILNYLKRGLDLSVSIQQYFLIFNGAIYIWNNFLHIFRSTVHDSKLKAELLPLFKEFFEAMKNALKQIEVKNIVYYDMDSKIQVFANIGLMYARLLENQKQNAQVEKICEDLLLTNLSPNTRKLINGIKARVGGGKAVAGKPVDPKKGGSVPQQKASGFNDSFIFEVVSQLELIQNSTNKAQIQSSIIKCFQNLESWKPNENDETELELHAELWVKLARLATKQETVKMYKYAIRCSQNCLSLIKQKLESNKIPSNRLRWYSLAEFLYSESLLKVVNPQTQEPASIEKLLFASLDRALEAAFKGYKCSISLLVLDAAKQVWNVSSQLQDSRVNRAKLLKPIQTTLFYLKEVKENSQIDLILLLSQLYFKSAVENNQFKNGEDVADMLFELVPKNLQRSLWQAKMIFMSKQGKNELQAISSIKEADPSLQAKLWVKLARISIQPSKQQSAYNKAIQILKKEHSVEVVEVLIEYSEWQLRVGKESVDKVIEILNYAADQLIQIEYNQVEDETEAFQDDKGTSNSRSVHSKRSLASRSLKSSQKDKKFNKPSQKKGPLSIKSKQSGLSRMNRSGRAAKAIKSKNTKSVFAQREEDPNPESLNCVHYERLFRIYTILASICSTPKERIHYAFLAKRHLQDMLRLSIKTFNQFQQNSAKFNEKQQKNNTFKTMKFPEQIEEWIKLQLPKQFVQKIKKLQNYNFVGVYAFEKPQLTYNYICKLIQMFESYGLSMDAIPLYFFTKYLSKYIINNEQLQLISDLRLKENLLEVKHPEQAYIKINFDSMSLPESEIKKEEMKSSYHKNSAESKVSTLGLIHPPNLIKSYHKYQCWFQIGKTLISFGEIYLAKVYLHQALKNANILSNFELIGLIHIYLAEIAYYEGQNNLAIEQIIFANKYCKSSKNWQCLISMAAKILISLKKLDHLKKFMNKIYGAVTELIEESKYQNKDKAAYQAEVLQLKNILLSIEIILTYTTFKQLTEEDYCQQNIEYFNEALHKLHTRLHQKLHEIPLWTVRHYQLNCHYFDQILEFVESAGGKKAITLTNQSFKKILSIVINMQKTLLGLLSYTGVHSNEELKYNKVNQLQIQCRFLLVKVFVINHKKGDQAFQDTNAVQSQPEEDLGLHSEKIQQYFIQLNSEIQKKIKPVATNLTSLENAIAILRNLEVHINQDSYLYARWLAVFSEVQTLHAIDKHQLENVWKGQLPHENDDIYFAQDSLEAIETFRKDGEPTILSFQENQQCHSIASKGYASVLQNKGQLFSQQYFQYLCKYQHSCYSSEVLNILKSKLDKNNRFLSSLRLLECLNLDKMTVQKMLSKDKINIALNKFPTYTECLNLMPKNSAYIILQLNKSKDTLYFGCLFNEVDQEQKKVIAKKKDISKDELQLYVNLKKSIIECKKNMMKTPFEDEQKIKNAIDENQEVLQKLMKQLNDLNSWWTEDLLQYLKKPKEVTSAVVDVGKDKKNVKDQKKKGGKEEVAAYESPYPPSPSGIQSIVFLIDQFLYNLPFEQLHQLDIIPAISRDLSLFYNSRKLQEIGYQAELNNSNGFGADKGKYFSYDFKEPTTNFKSISEQITKASPTVKFEGVDSTLRYPSVGEYSRFLSQQGFIQVYGIVDFINHIKFNTLVESIGSNKAKLLIVMDNLNYKKSTLNKFIDLNAESIGSVIDEEEVVLTAALNLMNISLIKNRWTLQSNKVTNYLRNAYKCLGTGNYIGSVNKKQNSEEKPLTFEKLFAFVNGPAILRF